VEANWNRFEAGDNGFYVNFDSRAMEKRGRARIWSTPITRHRRAQTEANR